MVRLHNGGVALLLAVEFRHQVVQICLRVGVLHLDLGRFLCQLIFDGEQQVRLAQARFAVDEQRRAGTGRVCKHGEFERRSVGKAVLRSEDEVFKREFRIRCEGCPVRVFLDCRRGRRRCCRRCGRTRAFRRWPAIHLCHHAAEIVGGQRVFDCNARFLAGCRLVCDGHVRGGRDGRGGWLYRRCDRSGRLRCHGFTGNIVASRLGHRRCRCGGGRYRVSDRGCICRGALRCHDIERDRRKGDLF